jgi:CO/xanthine dehydrogenase Mo-binding subunit
MTETTVTEPIVVEEQETRPGYAGQTVPRKEDKRLVQGEGVFFDDVKRHNMGYVHFASARRTPTRSSVRSTSRRSSTRA